MVGRHVMVLLWGHAPRFLCYQLDFLLDFFTEERSYEGLKDATSFGLLSDKSAEKLEGENSKIGHFSIGWARSMVLWWGHAPQFLCYHLVFLLDFFTEERSYQGLKDATSFGLICDKSTEIRGLEYWKNCQFSIWNRSFLPFFFLCSYANEAVTSLPVEKKVCHGQAASMENLFQYFWIFGLKLLSAFSRLDNKRGGIL